MGITNRSKDTSEQKEELRFSTALLATGKNVPLARAPYPVTLQGATAMASGVSGTPTLTLKLQRFVVGAGDTTISISGALTMQAVGTSGPQGFSMPAAGSSLLDLQQGDRLIVTSGGSNAACDDLHVAVLAQAVESIKNWG